MLASAKVAIGGKGGVGKTTVCAVWARFFADAGFKVLAIDADPNATLASAFGLSPSECPAPLIEMKQLIAERTGTTREALGTYFKMNPKVDDLPEQYWIEVDGVRVLVLGGLTQAGSGCACPEGAFLKALLSHTILQREEVVIVDLAAGVESMGRASIQNIDALAVVVEPGGRSLETATNVAQMARDLGIRTVGAVANKVSDAGQIDVIKARLKSIPLLGSVSYDAAVQEADLNGRAVFGAGVETEKQLREAWEALKKLMDRADANGGG